MKTGWKIFWIVSGTLALIGIIMCSVAFVMHVTWEDVAKAYPNGIGISYPGNQEDIIDPGDLEITNYSGVKSMELEVKRGTVTIARADGNQIRVEESASAYSIKYEEEGSLAIKANPSFLNWENSPLTIYVPDDYAFEEVSIDVGAGQINLGQLNSKKLEIDIGAGEMTVDKVKADQLSVDCGAGSAQIKGADVTEAEIDCGAGEVNLALTKGQDAYNYDLQCGTGEVILGEESYSGIGKGKEINNHVSKDISIDCGVGSVYVSFENQ